MHQAGGAAVGNGHRIVGLLGLRSVCGAHGGGIVDERRARPTEDLASVIANAVLDGEPIWPFQQNPDQIGASGRTRG
jgi:hypothetical protein